MYAMHLFLSVDYWPFINNLWCCRKFATANVVRISQLLPAHLLFTLLKQAANLAS